MACCIMSIQKGKSGLKLVKRVVIVNNHSE